MGTRTTSKHRVPGEGRGKLRWALLGGATALLVGGVSVVMAGAASADQLSATLAMSSSWDDGYVASYVVKNGGSSAESGWTVQFDLPAGDKIVSLWNGVMTASGSHYTVHNDDWNANLAPGASTDFGFQVQGGATGATARPANCTIDNHDCGGATAPTTPVGAPTTTTTVAPPVSTTTAPPKTTTTTAPPSTTTTTTSAPPATGGSSASFAPYADLSLYPMYDLAGAAKSGGAKHFNLAFITDGGGCTPKWGGVTAPNDPATLNDISGLRAIGGDVRISFGGASGTELAVNCSSAASLAAAYPSVINATGATAIDFDVEGASLANTAANDRRNQAIAILEKSNKALDVSYTLQVLPSGLIQDGVNLLTSAKTNNAGVNAVNIMAMDYGSSFPADMGQNAIDAATAVQATVKSVFGLADAAAWQKVAVTPMIGVNDVSSETFTVANAQALVNFAKSKHLAWLSFWSATRDKQCDGGAQTWASPTCSSITQSANAFAQVFNGYTG